MSHPNGYSIKQPTQIKLAAQYHVNWSVIYPESSYKIMDPVLVALSQNIQRIFVATLMRSFEEAGVLKSKEVVRLKTGRLVTEKECCLVHSEVFWQNWIDSDNISEEERDKLAKEYFKKEWKNCGFSVGKIHYMKTGIINLPPLFWVPVFIPELWGSKVATKSPYPSIDDPLIVAP